MAATLSDDTPKGLTMTEVTKDAQHPQDHWTVVGAIKAARAVIKAADALSFAAQITGGTAGRDAALCAAIAQWTAERDKQKQVLRIIELEGNDPEIGAGFELFPSALTAAQSEVAALRGEVAALKEKALGFIVMWATQYALNMGWGHTELHPTHYDLLAEFGGNMEQFTRAALAQEQGEAP